MAYAALISLANTIDMIQNHNQLSIPLEAKQQIISLSEYVTPFQTFLEKFPNKFNSLEGRMRELVSEAEDIIEYYMLEQVSSCSNIESEYNPSGKHELQLGKVINEFVRALSKCLGQVSECHSSGKHELQLEKVIKEIDSMAGEVKKIEDSLKSKGDDQHGADSSALSSSSTADSSALSSSSTAPPICKDDAIVGFEDHRMDVKYRLCGESSKLEVIPICGMGGIGKTTLAKYVYNDPLIMENFVIRVWVTISQDYSAQRILSSLLESLKEFLEEFKPDELEKVTDEEKLYKMLIGRKYLVVMDDMWSSDAWDVVRKVFPDDGNGSRIMLTTRLSDVASYPDSSSKLHEMQLMDADRSWDLLKQKVFEGDEDCPSELQKIGKEIARSCKGLPLAIVVIAGLLSTVSKNRASWQEIAENVKSAETTEKEQIEEILSLSYTHLPQYLRPCFLYMGSFPEDEEISVKKLIRLWIAEGFMKPPMDSESFEKVGEECLEELVKRNLVLVKKRKCDGRRIRSCSLHDLMRDLCIRKAHETKLFLNLMEKNIEKESFIESMQNQRRVNVDSSSLTHLSSLNGSTIHSVKCSRRCLVEPDFLESVRLLRVLDAEPASLECSSLWARLYEIFHLRYLAISIRDYHDISRSSLKLQNLQTLIINKEQLLTTSIVAASHLRLHWSMPQLRHVYFYGTICFYDPKETDCSLESLQTLSHVEHKSCNEMILKKIPNLKKLKIKCSGGEDTACLNDLVHLHRLESLEVYADIWKYETKFTFPRMLKKLSLRNMGLRWNGLAIVGSLPNLLVLKLKDDTCFGSTWETTEGVFLRLEVLVMEKLELENWITESSHFPCLKRLLLHSCRKLNGIPKDIGEIPTLELIEVKGKAKKSLVKSAEEIQKEQEELGNNTLQVLCINAKTIDMIWTLMRFREMKDDEDEYYLDGGYSDEIFDGHGDSDYIDDDDDEDEDDDTEDVDNEDNLAA